MKWNEKERAYVKVIKKKKKKKKTLTRHQDRWKMCAHSTRFFSLSLSILPKILKKAWIRKKERNPKIKDKNLQKSRSLWDISTSTDNTWRRSKKKTENKTNSYTNIWISNINIKYDGYVQGTMNDFQRYASPMIIISRRRRWSWGWGWGWTE